MAIESGITLIGNMTRDPELRFTPAGDGVCNFGVAVNKRVKNRDTDEWEDGTPTFIDCVAWRELGEHAADSLSKGDRVVVVGHIEQRSWETDDGEKRSKLECVVDAIGPELRWATADVTKVQSAGRRNTPPVEAYDEAGGGTATKTRAKAKAAAPPPDYDEEPF